MKAIFALAMLTLLGNVQASTSAQIIIAGDDYIDIAYKTTSLPYNTLLGRGAKCYLGTSADVKSIVNKMIDNHLYGRENIQSLDVISTRYNNEIVVSLYSSRGNHHITLSKCNIE
ncbi:MAG TPA: hypothetical protein VKY27_01540 [Bacteriovoracaceae bacterium]|nr:hypothetical protein [Bacteriovoracaceae bacterium]